jgi:hypothetical protein
VDRQYAFGRFGAPDPVKYSTWRALRARHFWREGLDRRGRPPPGGVRTANVFVPCGARSGPIVCGRLKSAAGSEENVE